MGRSARASASLGVSLFVSRKTPRLRRQEPGSQALAPLRGRAAGGQHRSVRQLVRLELSAAAVL